MEHDDTGNVIWQRHLATSSNPTSIDNIIHPIAAESAENLQQHS